MSRLKWVDELLQSLIKGHRLMDPSAWAPPNPFLLGPLFEDLWLEKIQQVKSSVDNKKINYQALAKNIMGPSCIRKEFRWALWAMKLYNWPLNKRLKIINFYKDILSTKAPDDLFNMHQAHWHSQAEIQEIIENSAWQKTNEKDGRVIGQISANCPALAWGMFTDFFYHRAYEVYGLYNNVEKYQTRFDKDSTLIIRQFGPFSAPELWQHSINYPAYQIIIKAIYKKITANFDYINHFTTNSNLLKKMTWFCVEINGRPVDINELRSINEEIMRCAIEQDAYLKQLSPEEKKLHTMRAKFYALKELFDAVGLSWKPSKEVIARIKDKPLLEVRFTKFKDQADLESFWYELFDPYHKFKRSALLNAQTLINQLTADKRP